MSVKVSVRQRKTTMEEARRREAKSVDLPAYSANSPVIAGSLFRLHTAEVTDRGAVNRAAQLYSAMAMAVFPLARPPAM